MSYSFSKLVGAGNDFIFVDHQTWQTLGEYSILSQKLCDRAFGIGADGFAAFEVLDKSTHHYRWHFFNNDGSSAEMCGNAARCAGRYLFDQFGATSFQLEALCGLVRGEVSKNDPSQVSVAWELQSAIPVEKSVTLASGQKIVGEFVNTGVPHFVLDETTYPLTHDELLEVQKHSEFSPDNTNVTMLNKSNNTFKSRSFERGVENFTLACGTGVIASAIRLDKELGLGQYTIEAPGGILSVILNGNQVTLGGPADLVFKGQLENSFFKSMR